MLADVSLDLPAARITAIIGPSGAGKTSLLRLLNRLEDPAAGEAFYADRPLSEYPVTDLRRRVGFVFQTPALFEGSVRENLAEAGRIAGMGRGAEEERPPVAVERARAAEERARAAEERARTVSALAELDVGLLDRDSRELSVGQQQRAMLARALVGDPEALLLDEPTAALDSDTSKRLLATVRRLVRDRGLTVVIATHRVGEVRAIADHTVTLREGRVAEVGPASGRPGR